MERRPRPVPFDLPQGVAPGADLKRDGVAPAGEPRPQSPQFGRRQVRAADRHGSSAFPTFRVSVERQRRVSSIIAGVSMIVSCGGAPPNAAAASGASGVVPIR